MSHEKQPEASKESCKQSLQIANPTNKLFKAFHVPVKRLKIIKLVVS